MNRHQFIHEAKSKYAYAVSSNEIHLRLKCTNPEVVSIQVIHGDPFMWEYHQENDTFVWQASSQKTKSMTLEFDTQGATYWFASVVVPTKRVKYAFLVNNQYLFGSSQLVDITKLPEAKYDLFNYFNFPYLLEVDFYKAPDWVKKTVWYSIFPDRFYNHDNQSKEILPWDSVQKYQNNQFFGGNLKGITAKLGYLEDLGITGIYLTPIFKAPSAHKYDTVDYFDIDPSFGTKADLKELVDQAHQRGIRIMLDAVFNHVSNQHPFFQDVLARGIESPYFDYFYIHSTPVFDYAKSGVESLQKTEIMKNLNYETFAFTPRMPKLNTENPMLRSYLLEVARYWIEEFHIDGWRLDVANEISHDFWREFRKTVKNTNPDCFILGENWDDGSPWLSGDQHDAIMNYSFLYPIWSYFSPTQEVRSITPRMFQDQISLSLFQTPKHVQQNMFNLIDSHDTKRSFSVMNEDTDLMKLVYLFQFSLPGSPSIYYGGEIGIVGEKDPDNRRCMIWEETKQNHDLKTFLQDLIANYKKYSVFQSVDFRFIHVDESLLIYQKEDIYFFLNIGQTKISIQSFLPTNECSIFWSSQPMSKMDDLPAKTFLLLQQKSPRN